MTSHGKVSINGGTRIGDGPSLVLLRHLLSRDFFEYEGEGLVVCHFTLLPQLPQKSPSVDIKPHLGQITGVGPDE